MSMWEQIGAEMIRSARGALDWIMPDTVPDEVEGSYYDYAYEQRHYTGGEELSGKLPNNQPGPFADDVVNSAYNSIGEDIIRFDRKGRPTKSWVCAKGVCDIVEGIMPWPEDSRGEKSIYNPHLEDAFSGTGPAGKLFKNADDFNEIKSPNDLAKGDIMIINSGPNARSGTHSVIVTGVYDDRVEIVHEGGQYEPILSKSYHRDFLDESFRSAFRYWPTDENWTAFNEMNLRGD